MTLEKAFRNRGLLVPEGEKPYYRITYGENRYTAQTLTIRTTDWRNARKELSDMWDRFTEQNRIDKESILEIQCVEPTEERRI